MNRYGERTRVVFDCMIYLQATANENGPAASALRLVEQGQISLFISREILNEIKDVLSREKIRKLNPRINDVSLTALLKMLEKRATLLKKIPAKFSYPRDPKDEPYINLAIAAEASFLVSRDNDLLDLMDWNNEEGRNFMKRFRFLKIVDPIAFLQEVAPSG